MGADKGALVALQTFGRVPIGQAGGDAPLVVLGGAHGISAVLIGHQGGDRQIVAPLAVAGDDDILHHIGQALVHRALIHSLGPGGGDVHLHGAVHTGVHGGHVHVDHLLALLGVGLLHGLLHVAHGVLHRHHAGEPEEGGLQNHVGVVPQAQLPGQLVGVHDVELHVVVRNVLFHIAGQLAVQLGLAPGGIQQEGAAVLDLVDHVVLGDVGLGVAGQKVRGLDEVGGADGLLAEAQVAFGDAVGLLGVVLEVRLGVHPGVVADDLGGVLVGAHGAVGPQAPELAGYGVGGLGDEGLLHIQTQVGHVVHHADGKHLPGLRRVHIVIDRLQLGGSHVLGGQAVTATADHGGVFVVGIGGADIQIHRAGDSAGLLGAVHGGNLLHRAGDGA